MDVFHINYDDFDGRLDFLINKLDLNEEYFWLFSGVYGYPHNSELNFYNGAPQLRTKTEILSLLKNDTYFLEGGFISLFKCDKRKENIMEWGIPNADAFEMRVDSDCPLQHPLAEVEIFLNIPSGLVFKSNSEKATKRFLEIFPQAQSGNNVRESVLAKAEERKKNKKKAGFFRLSGASLLAVAVILGANLVIFGSMLEWGDYEFFMPWGIILIALMVCSVTMILLFSHYNSKDAKEIIKKTAAESVTNFQIKSELDFLIQHGFSYKLYQIPHIMNRSFIDVHRFERDGFVVEVARSVFGKKRASVIVEFKCGKLADDGAVLMTDLAQCRLGTAEERNEFAFAVSRRRNVFNAGKNLLLKNIERLNADIAVASEPAQGNDDTTQSDLTKGGESALPLDEITDSDSEISLPAEFYEMEAVYNRRMRKYRILSTVISALLSTGIFFLFVITNTGIMPVESISAISSLIAVVASFAAWNLSEYFIARYCKSLNIIRLKQREIFNSVMLKHSQKANESASVYVPPQTKTVKPQSGRSIIPAIALALAAIIFVASGALLKEIHEGFFVLGIAFGATMLVSTLAYIMNVKLKKAAIIPSTAFVLFIFPYFLAYFLTVDKPLALQAAGYSVATTFVILAAIFIFLVFFYVPNLKKRTFLSRPEFLFILSAKPPHHYIYYKNLRAVIVFGRNNILELTFQKFEINNGGELLFTDISKEENPPQNIYTVAQKLLTLGE